MHRLRHALVIALTLWSGIASVAAESTSDPIGLFDLGYTTRIDATQPDAVRRAWDHCHAVATLQGIVNRAAAQAVRPVRPLRQHEHRRLLVRQVPQAGTLACKAAGSHLHGRGRIGEGLPCVDPAAPWSTTRPSRQRATSPRPLAGVENLIAIRYDPAPCEPPPSPRDRHRRAPAAGSSLDF